LSAQEAAAHAPPEHHTSTGLDNVKLAMWAFLGSECLFFGSLISTYLLYRNRVLDGPRPHEIYDISRVDRDERIEHVIAFNNSETTQTADVQTFSPAGVRYRLASESGVANRLTTDADGSLTVSVPPLGFVIYRAQEPVPASDEAPGISITTLEHGDTAMLETNNYDGHAVPDRIEVAAELDEDILAEVTFAVREGDGEWEPIGTDDNAPYRVFYDASHLMGQDDTRLSFRAIVNDLSGHLAADQVVNIGVEFIEPGGLETPYALIHYNRPAGDYGDHTTGDFNDFWGLHLWGNAIDISETTDWTSPKPFLGEDEYGRFAFIKLADDTQPVNFIVHRGDIKDPVDSPDRSFDPGTTPEIWLKQGDVTVYTSQAEAQGFATVHYACAPDCSGVTIDATSDGAPVVTNAPPDEVDGYGAEWRLSPPDLSLPLTVTIKVGGVVDIDAVPFTPTETPAAWFEVADQVAYPSRGAAEDFAVIHYRRPAGDYGDPASPDFNDFWGLHVWTGAATETQWPDPLRPVGEDAFGVEFRIDLVDAAEQLAYILHRGDTKDPGPDQFLVFAAYGHEVWQVQDADPEQPYVAPVRRQPPGP